MPQCWANLSYIKVAILSSNKLLGPIPSSIGGAYSLGWLQQSNNSFIRQHPQNLENCTQLMGLDIGDNKLPEKVPEWIGNNMLNLAILRLSSRELIKVDLLSNLNLSNNNLSGSIPNGPQLQKLNRSSDYEGNPGLCEALLAQQCEVNRTSSKGKNGGEHGDDGNAVHKLYLYDFVVGGFAPGLWGYFGVLIFKKSWRQALFGWMGALLKKMMGRS
ncbi:receptor like protein 56 [Striga hermonthica]|uniref:Receptor like protein 56 n=1 Tax=Striga hermonthica TaxID=68872 RepID=A0A9N7R608_STRHE|nr:receptor like protein 56 [Striga hermonthica]